MSTWFETDWGREQRQSRELEELRDELSYASTQTGQLRSRLAEVTGSLEARVNRLAIVFDAFVELSDLRQELIAYAGAAEVRQHAGRVLAALAAGDVPPAAPPDVPGYWLHPAVAAVAELAAGGDATKELTEATERDDRRTATFVCLALVALGRRAAIRAEWVEAAFGEPGAEVTALQRTLWLAAARGGLGEAGAQVVSGRLAALAEPGEGAEPARSWLGLLATPGGTGKSVLKDERIDDQASAAGQLRRLRVAVERIADDQTIGEPDVSVLRADDSLSGAGAEQPTDQPQDQAQDQAQEKAQEKAQDKAGGEAAEGEGDGSSVVDMLRLVIGEGSEAEHDLLARVAVLRAQLNDTAQGPVSAQEPAGKAQDLLATDLGGEAGPHLAAFALRQVAPALVNDAEALHGRAVGEAPDSVWARIEGEEFEIAADGPLRPSIAEAEARMRTAGRPTPASAWYGGLGVAGIGLVAGTGLGFVHWFWIVAGLVVAAFGARSALQDRDRRAEEQRGLEQRVTRMRATVDAVAGQLASYRDGQAERVRMANEDLEVLKARLSAG
jgi:hypothetical protein